MSEELSAVIANGLGRLLVHLLDVDLKPVLLRECCAAHGTSVIRDLHVEIVPEHPKVIL